MKRASHGIFNHLPAAAISLLTGLTAYYSFDNGLSTDDSGNGNTLTPVNSPVLTTGKKGNGVLLDQAASQVLDTTITIGTEFTLAYWAVYDAALGGFQNATNTYGAGLPAYYTATTSGIALAVIDLSALSSSGAFCYSTTPVVSDTWYFHSLVFSATQQRAESRVNVGGFTNDFQVNWDWGDAAPFAETFEIGATSGSFTDGHMDEIGLWNRALTEDELQYMYFAGKGRTMTAKGIL